MYYTQDIQGVFGADANIASLEGPVISGYRARIEDNVTALKALAYTGNMPLLTLPSRTDDLPLMEAWIEKNRREFQHLVVLGTGGSSLGGHTMVSLTQSRCVQPRVHFIDNTDPESLERLMHTIDLRHTSVLATSKSGTTVDTLAPLLVLQKEIGHHVGAAWQKHFTAITVPGPSPLREIATAQDYTMFTHDPKLGGRFSVFSEVGLLPAGVAGLDIRALRDGAQSVVDASLKEGKQGGLPGIGAAIHKAMMHTGRSIAVVMPYAEKLDRLSAWYRQTWAESVGKNGNGSTPVRALGAVDQHSQLQLYLDGPKDKFFTLILPSHQGSGPPIPGDNLPEELHYLRGKTMGDIIAAQADATVKTLVRNGCPTRVLRVNALDETTLGALLMHFMLETIFTAQLLEVNPFDQPAVEESKVLARQYLGAES